MTKPKAKALKAKPAKKTTTTTEQVDTTVDTQMSSTISKALQDISQAVQNAGQSAQSAVQAAEQIAQMIQQTGGSLSADKKGLAFEHATTDVETDEAHKRGVHGDTESMFLNKKRIVAMEFDHMEDSHDYGKALKKQEHNFDFLQNNYQQMNNKFAEGLNQVSITHAHNTTAFTHALNMKYAGKGKKKKGSNKSMKSIIAALEAVIRKNQVAGKRSKK